MLSSKRLFLIVIFVLFDCAYSKIAPDYIVVCPGLKSECLKKNIQDAIPHFVKGLPRFGINTTDPLYKKRFEWVLPGGLKIEFLDGVMTGLKSCIVDSAKMAGLDANLNFTCSLALNGNYKATGHLLVFAINGDGKAKIKSPSVTLNAKVKFEDRVRDGVIYREIKEYKVKYNYNEKTTFDITNLFKGNPEISQRILEFFNDNWKLMIDEFGAPIIESLIQSTFNHIKKFFHSVPRDELFIP